MSNLINLIGIWMSLDHAEVGMLTDHFKRNVIHYAEVGMLTERFSRGKNNASLSEDLLQKEKLPDYCSRDTL